MSAESPPQPPSSAAQARDASSDTTNTDPPFDGDPTWRVTRKLRDGSLVTIRPVRPEDRDELRRGFVELSPESRYFRFLNFRSVPSDELLTYLTSVDQKDHVAIGATIASPDMKTERGIGIARFIRLKDKSDTAEAAITVVDDMQRKGVAHVLLRELLRAAQAHHIKTLRGEVLADNETMRSILEHAGAHEVLEESGSGTITYDVPIPEEVTQNHHDKPTLFDILRTAAETMALRFRRQ